MQLSAESVCVCVGGVFAQRKASAGNVTPDIGSFARDSKMQGKNITGEDARRTKSTPSVDAYVKVNPCTCPES